MRIQLFGLLVFAFTRLIPRATVVAPDRGMFDQNQIVAAGVLPIIVATAMFQQPQVNGMSDLHVDLAERCVVHNTSADRFAPEMSKLDALAKDGLVERVGYGLAPLSECGHSSIRSVTRSTATLSADDIRFSQAS